MGSPGSLIMFLAATSSSRSDDVINEQPLTAVWFEILMTFHTTLRPDPARDSTPDPERYQGNWQKTKKYYLNVIYDICLISWNTFSYFDKLFPLLCDKWSIWEE